MKPSTAPQAASLTLSRFAIFLLALSLPALDPARAQCPECIPPPPRLVQADGNVMRISPSQGGRRQFFNDPVTVNGNVYFAGSDVNSGRELWRTDGTEAGTLRVKDIRPGPLGSRPSGLVNVDGTLFFFIGDESIGFELWKSDGTDAGTIRIRRSWVGVSVGDPGASYTGPDFPLRNCLKNGMLEFRTDSALPKQRKAEENLDLRLPKKPFHF